MSLPPFRRRRFPVLLVLLCAVLMLAFGGAVAGILVSGAPPAQAGLFGIFFAIALAGFLWSADLERFTLDATTGTARISRRSLIRRREIVVPLAEVARVATQSRSVHSQRNDADMVPWNRIDRPVLITTEGRRHPIFKAYRGGERAADLAAQANAWLAAQAGAAPHPNE